MPLNRLPIDHANIIPIVILLSKGLNIAFNLLALFGVEILGTVEVLQGPGLVAVQLVDLPHCQVNIELPGPPLPHVLQDGQSLFVLLHLLEGLGLVVLDEEALGIQDFGLLEEGEGLVLLVHGLQGRPYTTLDDGVIAVDAVCLGEEV